MKRRRKKSPPPLTDEEMARLSTKPRWWLEQQEEIAIVGRKLPFGIEAAVEYKGIKYSGVLYPVEVTEK
jgi:hypothetical protein